MQRVASAPAAARSIAESCAGLPLALRVAGERLSARPAHTVPSLAARLADSRRVLDELATGDLSIRSSLDGACEFAPTAGEPVPGRHALCLLARLTTPAFSLAAAASALRTPEAAAERLLDALIDAHLLAEPAPHRYRLPELVRLYATELAADLASRPTKLL